MATDFNVSGEIKLDIKDIKQTLAQLNVGLEELSGKLKKTGTESKNAENSLKSFFREQRMQDRVTKESIQSITSLALVFNTLSANGSESTRKLGEALSTTAGIMNGMEFAGFGLSRMGQGMSGTMGMLATRIGGLMGPIGLVVGVGVGLLQFFDDSKEKAEEARKKADTLAKTQDDLAKATANAAREQERQNKAVDDFFRPFKDLSKSELKELESYYQGQVEKLVNNIKKLRDKSGKVILESEEVKIKHLKELWLGLGGGLGTAEDLKKFGEWSKKQKVEMVSWDKEVASIGVDIANENKKLIDLQSKRDRIREAITTTTIIGKKKPTDEVKPKEDKQEIETIQEKISLIKKEASVTGDLALAKEKLQTLLNTLTAGTEDAFDVQIAINSLSKEEIQIEKEKQEAIRETIRLQEEKFNKWKDADTGLKALLNKNEKSVYRQEIENIEGAFDVWLANAVERGAIQEDIDTKTKEKNTAVKELEDKEDEEISSNKFKRHSKLSVQIGELAVGAFLEGKDAQIANAIISGYKSAIDAYGWGWEYGGPAAPYLSVAMAAMSVLATTKQIQAIKNTTMKGHYAGGYTGDGGMYEEAGVVHRGEIVFEKNIVDKYKSPLMNLRRSLQGNSYLPFNTAGMNNSTASEIKKLRNDMNLFLMKEKQININLTGTMKGQKFLREEFPKFEKFNNSKKA